MQQMCSLIHKANLIIEYPFKSLQQEIHERSRMKSRFFSEEEVWSIFYSCCSALQTLYEGKITHESLQTKNIYIDKEGLIKLGDPILLGTLKNYIVMMPNNALSI